MPKTGLWGQRWQSAAPCNLPVVLLSARCTKGAPTFACRQACWRARDDMGRRSWNLSHARLASVNEFLTLSIDLDMSSRAAQFCSYAAFARASACSACSRLSRRTDSRRRERLVVLMGGTPLLWAAFRAVEWAAGFRVAGSLASQNHRYRSITLTVTRRGGPL